MSFWLERRKVADPDWVLDAIGSLSRTGSLYATRRLPGAIESQMIVVPVKRILRGVYGSNLKAASVLFWMALRELPGQAYGAALRFWLFTILRKDREAYYDAAIAKLETEEDEEANA